MGEFILDMDQVMFAMREVVRTAQVEPLTVSIEEAARRLSVSSSTVRRLIRGHKLLTVRIGGRVMVPMAELRRLSEPAPAQKTPEVRRGRREELAAMRAVVKRR